MDHQAISDWLLAGPAWVQYRTRIDLLGQPEYDPEVQEARQAMLRDAQVQAIVGELSAWPGIVLSSHKSAGQLYHKLNFLADIGLKAADPGMGEVAARVMEHRSAQGPFQLPMKIGPANGGSGAESWAWALCDAPLQVYALLKLGLEDDARVQAAVRFLAGLGRENGWPCAVSPELGSFRGPGRKDDPCPYATLAVMKVLSQLDGWATGPLGRTGVDTLLDQWEQRRERHPYMFYMGTDFCKLKAPLVWYDLLHVLDVLSAFPQAAGDPRLQDMLAVLSQKADPEGRFAPESVWLAWKGWEFAQKGAPSRWVTFLAHRILKRAADRVKLGA